MRRIRTLMVGILVMLIAVSIVGLSRDFIMIIGNHPEALDPAKVHDRPDSQMARLFYEALVVVDGSSGMPIPALATSWSNSSDGRAWTFNLRPNVKFHDGTVFDATDVKACIERELEIGAGESYMLTDISEVEIVDDLTVVIHLNNPSPDFIYSVARMFIPSSDAVAAHEANGDLAQAWFAENEAGSGSYQLDYWTRRVEIVADRFEDYWQGWEPYKNIDRMILRSVPEPATQALVMSRVGGNFADLIPIEEAALMRDNPALRVETYKGNPAYFMFNSERGPLANKLVREAVAHCFDREAFVRDAMNGFGSPLVGPIPGDYFGANTDLEPYEFDLDRARELLVLAGYPGGGFSLEFTYDDPWLYKGIASLQLQENLAAVGITLEITALTWLPWQARITDPERRPDIGFLYLLGSNPIPYTILSPMFLQSSFGHWAYWGYENDGFDLLLEKAAQTIDSKEREELYQICQAIVHDDVATMPIFEMPEILVFSSNAAGNVYNRYWPGVPNYYDLYFTD